MSGGPRVLLLHNRYRHHGGEERAVELQVEAMERGRDRAPRALPGLLGRSGPPAPRARCSVAARPRSRWPPPSREFGADVVHVHNMNPLFGPRALHAARGKPARG